MNKANAFSRKFSLNRKGNLEKTVSLGIGTVVY